MEKCKHRHVEKLPYFLWCVSCGAIVEGKCGFDFGTGLRTRELKGKWRLPLNARKPSEKVDEEAEPNQRISTNVTCMTCRGRGLVQRLVNGLPSRFEKMARCQMCAGKGFRIVMKKV